MLALLDGYVARLPKAKTGSSQHRPTTSRSSSSRASRLGSSSSSSSPYFFSSSSSPSFPLFSRLPPEIRLLIWRAALEAPRRFVQITHHASLDGFASTSRAPPILAVNRESRAEALAQLCAVPGAARQRGSPIGSVLVQGPPIYFCAARDVVVVCCHSERTLSETLSRLPSDTRALVRRLVLVYHVRRQAIWRSLKSESAVLLQLPSLEQLWIVQKVRQQQQQYQDGIFRGQLLGSSDWRWASDAVLGLVLEEGAYSAVDMAAWDRDEDARVSETKYKIDGSWIWQPDLGKVVCWHGVKSDKSLERGMEGVRI